MASDRKKPGVAFWATVVVVMALVLYPLSFGPACWIASRTAVGVYKLPTLYRPVLYAMSRGSRFTDLCSWYAEAGAPAGWKWVDVSDSAGPVWMWSQVAP